MKTAADLAAVIDATPRDIENWVARLNLSERYPATSQGKARLYTKWNAYELGLIAGLVRGGVPPKEASLYAASFLRQIKRGIGGVDALGAWFVIPAGNPVKAKSSDSPDLAALDREFGATTLTFVHIREIVRRVDQLYSEAS